MLAHIETGCGTEASGCGETALKDYVDGINLAGITVKLDGSDWTIDGYEFKFNSDDFKGEESTNKELDLKKLLDPNATEAPVTPVTPGG